MEKPQYYICKDTLLIQSRIPKVPNTGFASLSWCPKRSRAVLVVVMLCLHEVFHLEMLPLVHLLRSGWPPALLSLRTYSDHVRKVQILSINCDRGLLTTRDNSAARHHPVAQPFHSTKCHPNLAIQAVMTAMALTTPCHNTMAPLHRVTSAVARTTRYVSRIWRFTGKLRRMIARMLVTAVGMAYLRCQSGHTRACKALKSTRKRPPDRT